MTLALADTPTTPARKQVKHLFHNFKATNSLSTGRTEPEAALKSMSALPI